MKEFKKITLKNGTRVILAPHHDSLATTMFVFVEAGSKYETKKINGISHFLEHMCFKGTTKRPRPIDIAGELDGLGAQYNAFTGQEYTSYYVKIRNEETNRALDIIADLYLNPTFPEQEIEKEKGVIIEEINMYEDMPQRRVGEYFMELLYGDQPAGWSIAGRKEVIRHTTRNDFVAYRNKHYLAQATTIVVAGGFNERAVMKNIETHFDSLRRGKKGTKPKVKESQTKPDELIQFKDSDQTHLVLGFRAFGMHDKRRYALQVLADILGGGMGSRLFQKIREELGAAYYVHSSIDLYSDHGFITMDAGVDHRKIEKVISAGLHEFQRFTKEKVPSKELARSKEHLVGNLFLSLETSDDIGLFYGSQEVMQLSLVSPHDIARRIKHVSAEEIRSVARALFRNESLNLALIGPYKKRSFRDILRI